MDSPHKLKLETRSESKASNAFDEAQWFLTIDFVKLVWSLNNIMVLLFNQKLNETFSKNFIKGKYSLNLELLKLMWVF